MNVSTCSKMHLKTRETKKLIKKEMFIAMHLTQHNQDLALEQDPKDLDKRRVEIKNQDVKTFLSDNILSH